MRKKFLFLLFGYFLTTACADNSLTQSYEISRFKVLALVADKPETLPGETVTITPFISDILGNGRPLTVSASACLDPGVGVGALPTCAGSPSENLLAKDVILNGPSGPTYTGYSDTQIVLTTPESSIIFDQVSLEAQQRGVNYLVSFEFKTGGEVLEKSFKRIIVSTSPVQNTNPVFDTPAIVDAKGDLQRLDAEKKIFGKFTPESIESYVDLISGAPQTQQEKLFISWFVSRGNFSLANTNASDGTIWKPDPEENNSIPFVLVLVLRDNRGGMTVTQKIF